ncbi:MAG: hypothetical protein DI527_02050 [Chelatococcus sp.]|nr:MAG: hypothetical protein DI527_02050 [Chelatococcus sp.]
MLASSDFPLLTDPFATLAGGVEPVVVDGLIPTSARADTHVAPLRALATTERALFIASGDGFALCPGGKTLYTDADAPTTPGIYPVEIAVEEWWTGATRTITVNVEVRAALSTMTWWYAPTAQGSGDGSSAANAAALSALATNVAAANTAGRPAEHLMRGDLGTYARGSSTITLSVGGTSEMTRQRIRGVDGSGNALRSQWTGNRVSAPTTNQTLAYMFLLTNDASFISFEDFTLTNVSCFVNARGRDTTLGIQSFHREIEIKRFTASNVYRLFLFMPNPGSSTWPAFITATEGLRVWDVDVDYLGHSMVKGFNIHRLDTRRCTANGRGVSQTNNFPAMYDFSASFGSDKYDVCTRIMAYQISCRDLVDYQTTYSQGDMFQFDSGKIAWDGTRVGIAGDTIYVEADGTTIADYIMLMDSTGIGMSDGMADVKVSNLYAVNLTAINCKRGLRDWNTNQTGPSYVKNLRVYNSRWPATRGTDDHPCAYLASRSDLGSDLIDCAFVLHDDLTTVPDGSGRTMLGSDSDSLAVILGDTSRTNQQVDYRGWTYTNVKRTCEIFDRGGTTAITGFTGVVDPAFPTPVAGNSWKAGFSYGTAAGSTSVGTDIADLTGSVGTAVSGAVLHYEIVDDPDNKFEIAGNGATGYTLRLKNTLNYATKATHNVTVRATPGIVGSDVWRDPADYRTWQCWLGPIYSDLTLTIAVTGTYETETDSFYSTNGLTDPTGYWKTAHNAYIRALKDGGDWTTADILPATLAWNKATALLDLKLGFNGTEQGTMNYDPKLGWAGDGTPGTNIRWPTFDPSVTVGRNYLRDTASMVWAVETDVTETGSFCTMGGNMTFRPRKNATQGELRFNNSSVFNVTLGASGAAGAPIGMWAAHRRSSTSVVLRQDGVQRASSSAVSTAINGAGLLICGASCTTRGQPVYVGYLADDAAEARVLAAYALFKRLVSQFP